MVYDSPQHIRVHDGWCVDDGYSVIIVLLCCMIFVPERLNDYCLIDDIALTLSAYFFLSFLWSLYIDRLHYNSVIILVVSVL